MSNVDTTNTGASAPDYTTYPKNENGYYVVQDEQNSGPLLDHEGAEILLNEEGVRVLPDGTLYPMPEPFDYTTYPKNENGYYMVQDQDGNSVLDSLGNQILLDADGKRVNADGTPYVFEDIVIPPEVPPSDLNLYVEWSAAEALGLPEFSLAIPHELGVGKLEVYRTPNPEKSGGYRYEAFFTQPGSDIQRPGCSSDEYILLLVATVGGTGVGVLNEDGDALTYSLSVEYKHEELPFDAVVNTDKTSEEV